jgi:serralysin
MLIDHGQDTILDFQSGLDKIDLTAIDANSNLPGDQAFRFVNAFTGAGGEAILSGSTFRADIDGDLIVDVLFTVAGATQADFLL